MAAFPNDTFYAPGQSYYMKANQPVASLVLEGTPPVVLTNDAGFLAVNGVDVPADWSDFPTLSNNIKFDASNNLSNVSGNLYFNDELLAVAGAISNVADWSLYAAISNVDLQDNSILMKTGIALDNSGTTIRFGGDVLNTKLWSTLPATQSVDLGGNAVVNATTISGKTGTSNLSLSSSSNLLLSASNTISNQAGLFYAVADAGINPANNGSAYVIGKGGNRGRVYLEADAGITGFGGVIDLTAKGGSLGGVGFGGEIDLTATTPLGISNVTSAIKLSAAGINSYAGVTSSIGSTFGYNYIHGDVGVNLTAGLGSVVPNFPGTIYLYGTAGTECANGFYVDHIYPYSDTLTFPNLKITGNSLTGADVELSNVVKLDCDNGVVTGVSNATITNLLGVSTINGGPVPNTANWSSFPAGTDVNMSNHSITNLSNINGSLYVPTSNWANFPAVSNVNVSNYDVTNVRKVTFSNSLSAPNVGFWSADGFGGFSYPVPSSIINGGSNGDFRAYGHIYSVDRSGVSASYSNDIMVINQGITSNLPRLVYLCAEDLLPGASDIVAGLQDTGSKVNLVAASGTAIDLTKYNRTDTWIFTSGTAQNFTTASLNSGDAGKVWYIRNNGSSDIALTHNAGSIGTLHRAGGGTNPPTCYLYWNGTDLYFY